MAINVLYQNVRGLRSKLMEFKQNVLVNSPDIICITESWLNNRIFDHEVVSLSDYTIFRRDRSSSASDKTDGGGTFIAVRNIFSASLVPQYQSEAEDLWVSVKINAQKIYVCCVYLPPGDSYAYTSFTSKLDTLGRDQLKDNDDVLICGDFNFSTVNWVCIDDNKILEPYNVDNKHTSLIDTLSFYGFMQFNNILNINNKTLDLIFCNKFKILQVHRCTSPLVNEDVYHPSVEFLIDTESCNNLHNRSNVLFYNYKKANYDEINADISNVPWDTVFGDNSLENNIDTFYNILQEIIDCHVPKKYKNKHFPSYFSISTIKTIKEKNKFHKKWKIYRNLNDYNTFKILRKRSKNLINTDFQNYINNIENDLSDNTKRFWNFISTKKHSKSNIPNMLIFGDKTANNGEEICNLFSSYFKSVFVPEQYSYNHCAPTKANVNLDLNHISQDEVLNNIKNLDANKGAGPDKIPAVFLKNCSVSISVPLTILFNQSLKAGEFPEKWKNSAVIPIFKDGKRNMIKNYRPISKLSIIPKLFELLVYKYIYAKVKNIIILEQHGFFKGRSLESNLILYTEDLLGSFEEKVQVDAVYTDFSKAFDKISHNLLLGRLADVGINGSLLRWVESYIKNRSQFVSVQGYSSESFVATSGVPQGSHLGPLLFIIYLNNIRTCFQHSKFLLYADDLKVYLQINSITDCQNLQEDLNRLVDYCNDNSLFLNLNKCKTITFTRNINQTKFLYTINDVPLCRVTVIRDLGVIFDSKLLFDEHIDSIINSSSKMLGYIIRQCKYFSQNKSILSVYNAFVLSKVSFASVIWNPQYSTYINRIESTQNKFIKFLCYKNNYRINNGDYTEARTYFKLLTLENRRIVTEIILLYKILNNILQVPQLLSKINFNVPNRMLRSHEQFYIPFRRINCTKNSPVCRMLRSCNDFCMDIDLFSMSQETIKSRLKHTLLYPN